MIGSVRHAINIINCFSTKTTELGISELAAKLSMNRSTVHHLVSTLHQEGVLTKTANRKYRPGTQLLNWGNLVNEQYKSFFPANPVMEGLVKRSNETVHLAILENESMSYLIKKEPYKSLRLPTGIGTQQPLYCTALGKTLLAYQSPKFIEKILAKGLEKRTENTIVTREALLQELEQIRRQGYAIDNEEFEEGLFCIAAPVRDYLGNVVCALSVSGPEIRMNTSRLRIRTEIVKENAAEIAKRCDFV
ncbi:IclR family transcriptional regulator [Aneurinibacillus sp. BA2021]|nr:IclR family transcriptional regulator [Aneurinibacillus sp. BA2021]